MFKAFGLAVASEGFSLTQLRTELTADNATLTLGQIGAPRTLAAPHLVRRCAPSSNGYVVMMSAAMGGVLLLGGGYLLWLLHRRKFA